MAKEYLSASMDIRFGPLCVAAASMCVSTVLDSLGKHLAAAAVRIQSLMLEGSAAASSGTGLQAMEKSSAPSSLDTLQ